MKDNQKPGRQFDNETSEIIRALEKCTVQSKKDIIEYLKNNSIPDCSDDNINRISNIIKKLDEKENKESSLSNNYKTIIKGFFILILFLVIIFFLVEIGYIYNQYHIEVDKLLAFLLIICSLISLVDIGIMIYIRKIPKMIYIPMMMVPPIFFILCASFIEPLKKEGMYSFIGFGLLIISIVSLEETDRLNKSDSYNVMILILTIISLIISIYSVLSQL